MPVFMGDPVILFEDLLLQLKGFSAYPCEGRRWVVRVSVRMGPVFMGLPRVRMMVVFESGDSASTGLAHREDSFNCPLL
jgi:hypothetical protein